MSYLSQSAAAISDLPKKVQAALALRNLSNEFLYQRKYDGVSGIVLTGLTESKVISRTGTDLTSVDHIGDEMLRIFGPERVVFGELWRAGDDFSNISGDVRRHSASPDLQFAVFDIIDRNEYEAGFSETPYWQRQVQIIKGFCHPFSGETGYYKSFVAATYNPGTYGDYRELTKHIMLNNVGYDGGILRDPTAQWLPGKDKFGVVLKDKPCISFDLELIGSEEGKGRNAGVVGALLFRFKDGKVVKAGAIPDAMRRNPPALGTIHEIEAMGLSSKGLLREPRYKGQRFDKDKPDF